MYAVGAIVHAYFALFTPEMYEAFADVALVAIYREMWSNFVIPNLWLLLPAVILFEIAVAIALLGRGRVVKLANVAAGLFQLGLVLSGPWGVINLVLAAVHFALARVDVHQPVYRRSRDPNERARKH